MGAGPRWPQVRWGGKECGGAVGGTGGVRGDREGLGEGVRRSGGGWGGGGVAAGWGVAAGSEGL